MHPNPRMQRTPAAPLMPKPLGCRKAQEERPAVPVARLAGSRVLAGLLALGVATLILSEQPPDTWKAYRNAAMGFEVRYPPSWAVCNEMKGTMESVSLCKPLQAGEQATSIQFSIQRKINPRGLSISSWKDEMMKMQHIAAFPTEAVVVGGRPALLAEHTTGMGHHFTFFVPLNRTDIFQIFVVQPGAARELEHTSTSIISALQFMN